MAVRAKQCLARNAKSLQVNLVADAIARTREIDAVLSCYRLEKTVVICILKACLQSVVVNIGNRQLGTHPWYADGFKLQVSHRAGGVLCQCLVNFNRNFTPGSHFPGYQMRGYNFSR